MSYLERTKNFHEIYQEEIFPIFRNYEVFRRREVGKYWLMFFGGVIAVAFGFAFPLILILKFYIEINPTLLIIAMLTIIGLGIVLVVQADKKIKAFAMTIKTDCLPRLLKVFGDMRWCNNKKLITDSDLNDSGLFADFNIRTTDDEFEGTYKDIPIKMSETNLLFKSGSGKNRTIIPVFKGVVISIKSNKPIKNRTIVATKGDLTRKNTYWLYLMPFLYSIIQLLLMGDWFFLVIMIFLVLGLLRVWAFLRDNEEKLEEVRLEDPKFCKKFNVYSSDQVEARYLVTPSFMERFKNMNTVFGAKKAKCSFFGDEVMFAISTNKNLFEIGSMFKSLENPNSINEFYNELSSILNMVDYFKLDEKIGL